MGESVAATNSDDSIAPSGATSAFATAANFTAFARVRRGSVSLHNWAQAPGNSSLFLRDMADDERESESVARSPDQSKKSYYEYIHMAVQ